MSKFKTLFSYGMYLPFPGDTEKEVIETEEDSDEKPKKEKKNKGPKNVHLVMISHGLHSNTGADMIYMKEAIDRVSENARKKRQERREKEAREGDININTVQENEIEDDENDNEEQIITRGFFGNVCRTERGIKYLGKRLARYVLSLVWPDEPFPRSLRSNSGHSSISSSKQPSSSNPHKIPSSKAYKITSISFIGHSLGGLVQTYAIAYIHAHVNNFFAEVEPINFISLATPFLGII